MTTEMNISVTELIAQRDSLIYTKCYCEENIYKLCELISMKCPQQVDKCFVVFISNDAKTVPIWYQRASKSPDGLVVWDYHVIMVYEGDNDKCQVFDLDTMLEYPCDFERYFEKALRDNRVLISEEYYRSYRVIEARNYLKHFASDRTHMINEKGEWMATPPKYDCIRTAESSNNLQQYISMTSTQCDKFGQVYDSDSFKERFIR